MIELLVPVGNKQNFYSAINGGANAIYLGLDKFSARGNAENFTLDNLDFYLNFAHFFDCKVYLTVNTLISNSEIHEFLACIEKAYLLGVDAFILQDVFLGKLLSEKFPNIELHLSTQAGVNNINGAKLAKSFGFSRVVLARETEVAEIKQISSFIETEIFVHGAMCTSFSGQCYMSSLAGGNSGNRGLCKQPCRQKYSFSVEGKSQQTYAISLSDLCLKDDMDKIKSLGVKSLKIEGRMRSSEYTFISANMYRNAIDGKDTSQQFSDLQKIFNRGDFSKGYVFGQDKNLISDKVQNHKGYKLGKVESINGDVLKVSNVKSLAKGDSFKILRGQDEVGNGIKLNEDNKPNFSFKGSVKIGDDVHITKDKRLIDRLLSKNTKKHIKVNAIFKLNEFPVLECLGEKVIGDSEITKSITMPTTKEDIIKCLNKTDTYPYDVECSISLSDNVFVSKGKLNELRRQLYAKVFALNSNSIKSRQVVDINCDKLVYKSINRLKSVMTDKYFDAISNFSDIVFSPNDYNDTNEFSRFLNKLDKLKSKKYLYVPAFTNNKDVEIIRSKLHLFDGIYADGLNGIDLGLELKMPIFVGLGVNVYNDIDLYELDKLGIEKIALSKELSISQISKFKNKNYIIFEKGDISVMNLIYCPFKKQCKNCLTPNQFTMTDYANRKFVVKRTKLSTCRFTVFNSSVQVIKENFESSLVNIQTLNIEQAKVITTENFESIKTKIENTTKANTKRGVN